MHAPCISQSPGKDKPLISSSLCVSLLPWQQHCDISLPSPGACVVLVATIGFCEPVQGFGGGRCLSRQGPFGCCCGDVSEGAECPGLLKAIQLIPWVSCRAAGCPPEGHSSPVVSLGCLGSPWRRQLSARAREMLLGSCTWAAAMIPLCTSLAGDS